jgi:hypothetical protein
MRQADRSEPGSPSPERRLVEAAELAADASCLPMSVASTTTVHPPTHQHAVVLDTVKAEPRPVAAVAAEVRPALTASARAGGGGLRSGRKSLQRGRTEEGWCLPLGARLGRRERDAGTNHPIRRSPATRQAAVMRGTLTPVPRRAICFGVFPLTCPQSCSLHAPTLSFGVRPGVTRRADLRTIFTAAPAVSVFLRYEALAILSRCRCLHRRNVRTSSAVFPGGGEQ